MIVAAEDSMAAAVEASLKALRATAKDKALVRLIERYAQAMDDAAEIAEAASLVEPENVATAHALSALRKRVEHQAVLAELGPKLQAALESLGASPKARAAMQKGVQSGGRGNAGANSKRSKLDALRDDADSARKH